MSYGDNNRPHPWERRTPPWRVWIAFLFLPALVSAAESRANDGAFFESRIRPLLAEHCYSCHSTRAEKVKGGLYLDSPGGLLKGGEMGPAIAPGDPENSLLIKAVRYTDADLRMPPKDRKLTDRQIADLTLWVQMGAPWPAGGEADATPLAKSPPENTDQDKTWWAFQPVRRVVPLRVNDPSPLANPIDAFVRAGLEAQGLEANPAATRRELIRRACLDLLGLPPTPGQIWEFEHDRSPDAWPRLIEDLLSRPQYGERWGRHWLDVARFAQSNGYERDGEKPEAWRYRDYVVKAFNEDKPYDQFIREQIAGDELDRVTFDSIVATGFQRLGVWDDEPDDKRMAEFDELDDVLSTTANAFLGLTLGCARCHDHKFDPIPQADYYRLLSFFRNLRLSEAAKYALDSPNYVPLAEPARVAEWRAVQEERLKPLQEKLATAEKDAERKTLMQEIEAARAERPPFDFALAVREHGARPPPTHILIRGNAGSPGAEVEPAFLTVLGARRPALPSPSPDQMSSGRRRALAEWIASAGNPLTARVMVNRIWQHHFGRGLVKTTSDFGRAGSLPTHPELLDWLATEFIASGWSVKEMHRIIMRSQTYQMSSRVENGKAHELDPGNDLLWRQNLRRLEAEALRDSILAISGTLNLEMGGRGFFPRISGEVLAGQSRPGLDWEISGPDQISRRSLYAYVRRTMPVPMLDAFDYSNTASPLSERPVTTVAPQALFLLNDDFLQQQAVALERRLVREAGESLDRFIEGGFRRAVGRGPTKSERQLAGDFVRRQQEGFASLRRRQTFRPEVPTSLSVSYMEKLKPEHFLAGPTGGWSYHRGRWSEAYEGIRTMERDRGPFALARSPEFSNGVIETRIILHPACESAGLLFRAVANGDTFQGFEVGFEPREQQVVLRHLTGGVSILARAGASLPTGQPLLLKIEARDARIRVWLGTDPKPVFDLVDSMPIPTAGRVGIRTWGAALGVEDLVLHAEGMSPVLVGDEAPDTPERRARQAFCLLLLNLNETVYVD